MTTQRSATHSGYPLSDVPPTRRTAARRAVRGARVRRGAAVAGSAFLIAGTALALSACGTDPSTGKVEAMSPVVEKNAGGLTKDVEVTVLNDTSEPVSVDLCRDYLTDTSACQNYTVTKDNPATVTFDEVQGTMHTTSEGVVFSAENPVFGEPLFRLATAANATPEAIEKARDAGSPPGYEPFVGSPTDDIRLVEGEVQQRTVNGHLFQLERRGDTDVKVMRLIILS
jgi:hypothetical protein